VLERILRRVCTPSALRIEELVEAELEASEEDMIVATGSPASSVLERFCPSLS
jgi:hypothetical protein